MTYMFGLAYHARSLGIQDHLKLSGQNKKHRSYDEDVIGGT